MLHHLIPELDARAELFLVEVAGILESSHLQIELVTVLRSPVELLEVVEGRGRSGARLAEEVEKVVVLRQYQSSVVMHVVAVNPVGDGSLWGDGFDCRVTVNPRHSGVEARIRD